MADNNRWTILYIGDDRSDFDADTQAFATLFKKVDRAGNRDEAVNLFNANQYDIVIADLSAEPEKLGMLKQLQDINKEQCIFAMVSPRDNDKLYGIADLGIHAFELLPEQFELALAEIAKFDPYAVHS